MKAIFTDPTIQTNKSDMNVFSKDKNASTSNQTTFQAKNDEMLS